MASYYRGPAPRNDFLVGLLLIQRPRGLIPLPP